MATGTPTEQPSDEVAFERSRAQLKEDTLAGVRWVTFGRFGAEFLLAFSTIALARLIPPAQFGLAAVALICQLVAQSLAAQGFGSPLVQRKEITREDIQTASALSVLSGLALTALVFAIAPLADQLFGNGEGPLIMLVAPIFLFTGIGVVPQAMLQRQLDFKRTSSIEFASMLAGVCVSVGLAVAGVDGKALVLGAVTSAAASSLMLRFSVKVPSPRIHRHAVRELIAFGGPAAGASLLYTAFRTVDTAIIAAQLGAAATGFYNRAYQLGVTYQSKISGIMQRVAFPVYSRTKDIDDMRALRGRIVRLHATALFPLLASLIAVGPQAIPVLFGPRWEPAVLPAQLMAVCGMCAVVVTGTGPLLMALGKPRALFLYNLLNTIGFIIMVLLTAQHGLTAVCIGYVVYQIVGLIATHYFLLQRLVGIPMLQIGADVLPAVFGCIGLIAAAVATADGLDALGASDFVILLVAGSIGILAYLAVVRVFFDAAWSDLSLVINRIIRRKKPEPRVAPPAASTEPA